MGGNIAGKGENAGYQHFPLFLRFQKAVFCRVVISRDCVVKSSSFHRQRIIIIIIIIITSAKFSLNIVFVFHAAENIVGKGVNDGHQRVIFFPRCFKKAFSSLCGRCSINDLSVT